MSWMHQPILSTAHWVRQTIVDSRFESTGISITDRVLSGTTRRGIA